MAEIYPTEKSREALTVFRLYEASGEWFDLSKSLSKEIHFILAKKKVTKRNILLQINA